LGQRWRQYRLLRRHRRLHDGGRVARPAKRRAATRCARPRQGGLQLLQPNPDPNPNPNPTLTL
jgi:hypothetical protein